ncbi:MAG: hypothetical protein A2X83_06285 [Desulfuromonadales bacterium GWD2_54_10]|nr:MAG: hypothetical protein A2X83_06285 [Desulfuromonadales bacterium GWD2_54_10]
MISEIIIRDWQHFDEEVTLLPYRRWLFRGQSNVEWELQTSLVRLFKDLTKMFELGRPDRKRVFHRDKHENAMIRQFTANAHLYLKTLPQKNTNLEWLSIMQHHGCPTRLLDVTASPYIALYFALESGNTDAAVYAFNHREFSNIDLEVLGKDYKKTVLDGNEKGKAFIIPFEPKQTNERLLAQQGAFLVPSNNNESFEQIISVYPNEKPPVKKFIITRNLRLELTKKLRSMNIIAATLFPGLDGFCRSLKFQVDTISQLERFEE